MTLPVRDYDKCVFVNCPFDEEYEPLLQAILFCLVRFGLRPRIATERNQAGETRLQKIIELIEASKYSIHDLSRCQAKAEGEHYRLNMPFELGLDIGCRQFGQDHSDKQILMMEEQKYRYQASISDLAGVDIVAHGAKLDVVIRKVRNWLVSQGGFDPVAAAKVQSEYEDFQGWHYTTQVIAGFREDDIKDYPTAELLAAMIEWEKSGRPRG